MAAPLTTRWRIQGGKEIARRLKRMDRDIRLREVDRACRAGARIIVNEAKARAPVESGEMRDAVIFRKARGSSNAGQAIYHMGIASRIWYFPLIEFGTHPHWVEVRKKLVLSGEAFDGAVRTIYGTRAFHPGIAANPFFRSAVQSRGPAAIDEVLRVLRRRIINA